MSKRPSRVRRTTGVVTRVSRHPGAKWVGSVASAILVGVIVAVLTTRSPSTPSPTRVSSSAPPTSPSASAAGVTLTASFIPRLYSAATSDGFDALLPRDAAVSPQMRRAPDCEHLHPLLARAGGVDTGASYVQLLLQNGTHLPVAVTQVEARVTRLPANDLTTNVLCSRGAGPLRALEGVIELDSPSPVLRAVRVNKKNKLDWKPAGPYFGLHAIELRPGETFPLAVEVDSRACVCAWELVAEVVVGGTPTAVVAEDGTQPFRTAGFQQPPPNRRCWTFDFGAAKPHLAQTPPPC